MTKTAFVLITADEPDKAFQEKILSIDGVQSICKTAGSYDYVIEVSADTEDILRDTITWKIRKISSIVSALTLLKVGT